MEALVCRACGFAADGEPGSRCPHDDTLLVARGAQRLYTFDERLGRTLSDRYDLVDVLGEGVMGQVFRAVSRTTGAQVAVKVIRRDAVPNEVARARFFREAKLLGRLTHPNTVALLDWGEDAFAGPYLVQELVGGRTLRALQKSGEQFSVDASVDIAVQVLDALDEAHRLGVVHRDIKPANLMLTEVDGRRVVKVLDFGLARVYDPAFGTAVFHTRAKAPVGTPRYGSPELLGGGRVEPPSDLYSVGIMLYELLTGEAPFRGGVAAVIKAHQTQAPPPLPAALPGSVRGAIETALMKDPAARFQSAPEMRAALLGGAADQAAPTTLRRVEVPRTSVVDITPAPPARAPAAYRVVVAVGLAAIVGAVLAFYLQAYEAPPDPPGQATLRAPPETPSAVAVRGDAGVTVDAGRVVAVARDAALVPLVPLDAAPPVDWGRGTADRTPQDPKVTAPARRPRPKPVRPRPRPQRPRDAGPPPNPGAAIRKALAACRCDSARSQLRSAVLPAGERSALQGELRRRCDMLGMGCNRGVGD